MYAAGKIPGSFFRREGRPTDEAVLTCRLIDRPLRPSFADGYRNETQVVATILAADQVNPHDVVAINGASAALMLSGLPFDGPLGAVRLAYSTDGEWIPHPTFEEIDESTFQLVVAGRSRRRRRRGHHDGRGQRHREGLVLLRGRRPQGHRGGHRRGPGEVQDLDRRVHRAPARAGRARPAWPPPSCGSRSSTTTTRSPTRWPRPAATRSPRPTPSPTRATATRPTTRPRPPSWPSCAARASPSPASEKQVKNAIRALTKKVVRERLVNEGIRIDGRGPKDLRPVIGRGGRAAHRPRLRPVPAGRDPGPQRAHPGHAPHGPAARHPRAADQEALHAPLQHAALLQRRDGPHRWHQAPRGRPRHARRAGPAAPRALPRGVALRPAPRVRGAVVQRLHLDGLGLLVVAVADGRRRADQGAGLRHRHGPGQGG